MPQLVLRFINSGGFVSGAIDFVTGGYLTHVEMQTPDGMWIGAHSDTGWQKRPYNYVDPKLEIRYGLDLSQTQYRGIQASAAHRIGTGYNKLGILGIMFRTRRLTTIGQVFCSQGLMDVTMENGLYLLNVQSAFTHLITPRDIHLSPLLRGRWIPNKEHRP